MHNKKNLKGPKEEKDVRQLDRQELITADKMVLGYN